MRFALVIYLAALALAAVTAPTFVAWYLIASVIIGAPLGGYAYWWLHTWSDWQ